MSALLLQDVSVELAAWITKSKLAGRSDYDCSLLIGTHKVENGFPDINTDNASFLLSISCAR